METRKALLDGFLHQRGPVSTASSCVVTSTQCIAHVAQKQEADWPYRSEASDRARKSDRGNIQMGNGHWIEPVVFSGTLRRSLQPSRSLPGGDRRWRSRSTRLAAQDAAATAGTASPTEKRNAALSYHRNQQADRGTRPVNVQATVETVYGFMVSTSDV